MGADSKGEQRAVEVVAVPAARLQMPFGAGLISRHIQLRRQFKRTGRVFRQRLGEWLELRAALLDCRDAAVEILFGDIALEEALQPENGIAVGDLLGSLQALKDRIALLRAVGVFLGQRLAFRRIEEIVARLRAELAGRKLLDRAEHLHTRAPVLGQPDRSNGPLRRGFGEECHGWSASRIISSRGGSLTA